MPTKSPYERPYTLTLRYMQVNQSNLIEYLCGREQPWSDTSPLRITAIIASIMSEHGRAAREFWANVQPALEPSLDTFIREQGQDGNRSYAGDTDTTVNEWGRPAYIVPDSPRRYRKVVEESCVSFFDCFFQHWRNRYFWGIDFLPVALDEVLDRLLGIERLPQHQEILRKRQRYLMDWARGRFFREHSREEQAARMSGWFDWVGEEETIDAYLAAFYENVSAFHWVWGRLMGMMRDSWPERGLQLERTA